MKEIGDSTRVCKYVRPASNCRKQQDGGIHAAGSITSTVAVLDPVLQNCEEDALPEPRRLAGAAFSGKRSHYAQYKAFQV